MRRARTCHESLTTIASAIAPTRAAAYRNGQPSLQMAVLPAAQTPPQAARQDLPPAQELSEVAEECITVNLKAGHNVVLTGARQRVRLS